MKKFKILALLGLALATLLFASSCMMPITQTQTCVVHRDLNKDLLCDVCGAAVPVNCLVHNDDDHDGKCDTNGCTVTLQVIHIDPDHTGVCEVCGKTVTVNHEDFDEEDGLCDICGKPVDGSCLECIDEDEDGECDVCGKDYEAPIEPCDECVDENGDLFCDVCGSEIKVCVHTDVNFDGKCDKCKKAIEGAVQLLNKGTTQFKLVLASGSTGEQVRLLDNLQSTLSKLGLTVEEGYDSDEKTVEYEILIGIVKNREEQYKLDPHVYGAEGYTVQLVGNKIVILGGSDSTLSDAIEAFKESFLGITESTKSLRNAVRYISPAQNVIKIQDNYDVSTITLLGEDIRDYKIVACSDSPHAYNEALSLQNTLYIKTGYWLDIVEPDDAPTEKVVIITYAAKTGGDGYSATFTEGKMEFISEYSTVMSKITSFFTKRLASAQEGTLNISGDDSCVENVRDVYYRDFGANGEDELDDAEAIKKAHEYANQDGHNVIASYGATYYIGVLEGGITVKTNVDWLDAKFILQDYLISPDMACRTAAIFYVQRDDYSISLPQLDAKIDEINEAGGIDASTFTSFDFNFGQPLFLSVSNKDHINYIRYGVNANAGATQNEVVLVDANGKLDPTTPFMFDYAKITSITAYPIDDKPITLKGGEFYTRPWLQQTETAYTEYSRGLKIYRSNVTVQNVEHYLIDEGDYIQNDHRFNGGSVDYGCPYGGFYSAYNCNNVRFYNCIASSHITYWQTKGAGMGSYDLYLSGATNVIFENVTQDDNNFFEASGQPRWGIMGSSGNKNVTFLNSKLSRFDAHLGIHNAYVINSEVKSIRIDGTGTFLTENSVLYVDTLVSMREDYGGFWHGNIILKNNTMVTGASTVTLFTNTWYNHDFGYPTALSTNIIIDGLKIYKDKVGGTLSTATVYLFDDRILTGATSIIQDYLPVKDGEGLPLFYPNDAPVLVPNKNQTYPPERIIIRNIDFNITIPDEDQYPWFENTVFEINKNTECVNHFDWTGDLKCDDCGADFTPCAEHNDYNNDGRCTWCGQDTVIVCEKHIDKELNGKCDKCNAHYVCDGHLDADEDRICDKCGGVLGCKEAHTDAGRDGYCDLCQKLIPTCSEDCVDEAAHDAKCDKCKADMVATIEPCDTCVDTEPADEKCDVCGGDMPTAEEE